MPTAQIKSLADKAGVSVSTMDNAWNNIKDGLKKSGMKEDDPMFYGTLVNTLKKKFDIKESLAERLLNLFEAPLFRMSKSNLKMQVKQLVDFLKKEHEDKGTALLSWLDSKDFSEVTVDDVGDEYKKYSDKDKSLPDWDEAISIKFKD